MQHRLLSLVTNARMLQVNQAWDGFAGDRIWAEPVGKEIWAKPLPEHTVGVVLFNRNGTTVQCMASSPIQAPCDDDPASATAAGGAQDITLHFDLIAHWLMPTGASSAINMQCQVIDVYGGNEDAGTDKALGSFTGSFTAKMVPAHGVAFVLVGNCTSSQ
jgi:hypothetical protein